MGRLPAREVMQWAAFERSFGPLTWHERADAHTAQICWAIASANGAKAKVDDFMPEWRAPVRWESDTDWLKLLAARPGGL